MKLQLAKSLSLAEDNVRVVVQYMGGGFGSKAGAQRVVHYAAKLAMLARRPVKLELTRAEEFVSHPRRYKAKVHLRLGARRDGTLTAVSCRTVVDLGCGSLFSGGRYKKMLHQICELYRCRTSRSRSEVSTPTRLPLAPSGGVRPDRLLRDGVGHGRPRGRTGHGSGRAPAQKLRPYADEERKIPYSSKYLDQCIEAASKAIGWDRRERLGQENAGRAKRRGIGLACYCLERGGLAPFKAHAEVILRRSGAIELRTGVAEGETACREAAVGLADREPRALQVPYDARPFELGRRVDDTSDGPFGREHRTDRAVRVHALDTVAVVRAAVPVEVPPGDAVLGRDDRRRPVQQRLDQRPARRVRVGLQAQEDVVDRADLGRVVGRVGVRGEIATRAAHPDSVLPHGRQMRSTGDEVHVGAGAMQRGADVGADGTGAENCDFHGRSSVRSRDTAEV